MANLVPLFLDKDSGKLVARDGSTSGGGGTLPPGCFEMCGYAFSQPTPAAAWFIAHNTGLSKGLVQVYTTTNELIIPDDVIFVDPNTIIITLSTAMNGQAYLGLIDDVP